MKIRFSLVVSVCLVMMVISYSLNGQDYEKKGWGYGTFGAGVATGGSDAILHFGGGAEFLIDKGFGIGLDLGHKHVPGNASGAGALSAGMVYVFSREQKTKPFVGGGYTLFMADGGANIAYIGGGVNHSIGESWGVRVEARDYFPFSDWSSHHILEGRIGVFIGWD